MENEERTDVDRVTIMTLHAAKGLEFDVVFLPGWEEGLFPHQRALEETGARGLEEERRLAYVGLTRARRRIFVSHAANRRVYNQWQSNIPSRFLEELPAKMVERSGETGLYGGGMSESGSSWGGNGWNSGYVNRRQRAQIEQTPAWAAPTPPEGGFAIGEKVHHAKFGNGRIIGVDGNKLEIAFDKAGVKKVIDSFVSLA